MTRNLFIGIAFFLTLLSSTLYSTDASAVACAFSEPSGLPAEINFNFTINCGMVTNTGTSNIERSSILEIGVRPCLNQCPGGSPPVLENKGIININNGSLNTIGGGTLSGQGTININDSGTLRIDRGGTVTSRINWNGGTLTNNDGTINLVAASTLNLSGRTVTSAFGEGRINVVDGSTLTGPGAINSSVVNSGGTVRPGGTLTLGSYAQSGNGRLNFNIGGLLPGTQYDVLKVNGPISINGGSIAVSLVNNFQPRVGDKFDILTGQIQRISLTSPFLSLPTLPAGEFWTRANFGSFFELAVAQVLPPGPVVGSPEPNSSMLLGSGFAWLVGRHWRKHARWVHAAQS